MVPLGAACLIAAPFACLYAAGAALLGARRHDRRLVDSSRRAADRRGGECHFQTAIAHGADVYQRVLRKAERRWQRLRQDQVAAHLVEERELEPKPVVEEPGVEAGLDLLTAFELE